MGLFSKSPESPQGPKTEPLSSGAQSGVAAASEQVKSKRGGWRPGSGRKPNDGKPVVAGAKQGGTEQNQTQASEADIEFVRTVAEAGLKILDRVETNIIVGLINSIDDNYVRERTDAYLKMREIGPGDVEVVVNAAGALAAKYSFLSKYAPEAALISWASIHGMAFHNVTGELKKLAVVVKQAKAKSVSSNATT
jgi:hypothetical protein